MSVLFSVLLARWNWLLSGGGGASEPPEPPLATGLIVQYDDVKMIRFVISLPCMIYSPGTSRQLCYQ